LNTILDLALLLNREQRRKSIYFSPKFYSAKRRSNIRLTWEAELARSLPSCAYSRSDSKLRDKPLTQVEAIVRNLFDFNIFNGN